jgi:hypothetical protein
VGYAAICPVVRRKWNYTTGDTHPGVATSAPGSRAAFRALHAVMRYPSLGRV